MHAAVGGQRRLPAAYQCDEGLQFIGLGVVNVVAGEKRQVVGTAAGGGKGLGTQCINMRCQGKVRERFIGPVHVQ